MLHFITLDALRVLFVRGYRLICPLWITIRGVTFKGVHICGREFIFLC